VSTPHPTPLAPAPPPLPIASLHTEASTSCLLSPPTKLWRKNSLSLIKFTTYSSEFDGEPVKDDIDKLLHHLDHLFLVGDLGEGHSQASPSPSPLHNFLNALWCSLLPYKI